MSDAIHQTISDLLGQQARGVEDALRDLLAARGIDPDDRTDGWEGRARSALADVELPDTTSFDADHWRYSIETTIRPRRRP